MDTHALHLLLVDDDEDDILLTRELIAEQGGQAARWVFAAVTTGAEGREALRQGAHDVYLIDYRIGAESGIELVREARAAGSLAPLVMLTGQGDEEVGLAAIQAGADDYLVKGRLTGGALERSIRYAVERKRAERERLQLLRERAARAEAEAALNARDQLLALASHELKTPLTSVVGNIQLLQRSLQRAGALTPRDEHRLTVAVNQLVRLSELVNTMLDVSRVATGQLQLARAPLDLCAFAGRVVDEAAAGCERHELTFHAPAVPVFVEADELRLEQVLQNLIGNAVKYSPDGGLVEVRVERRPDAAALRVRDHGIGIPADALPHLFERFFRADNARLRQITGMGMGLTIVGEIVKLHGGRMEVASKEGEGSAFSLLLPLLDTAPQAEPGDGVAVQG
ncbi:MAG TPA: ATP-binding protein [Chloroflexaceae bacterium]|nr:ATP-binding protein [Chloroflexaceae bacterium]